MSIILYILIVTATVAAFAYGGGVLAVKTVGDKVGYEAEDWAGGWIIGSGFAGLVLGIFGVVSGLMNLLGLVVGFGLVAGTLFALFLTYAMVMNQIDSNREKD